MSKKSKTDSNDNKPESVAMPTTLSEKVDPWIPGHVVDRITNDGRATRYRRMQDPESGFPKGIKLSPRKRVWRLSSILAWMEAQELKAANDAAYGESK
ncbi:helix-turn-helix transcriptional regulator [Endozoicomonas sp. ALB032]|uniref:helix-turn-helix transcriptional regulator n=1 Tax=Endozoicomonas sp. ALB032 TaxID=3403082 RepID=UPI003BB52851